MSATSSKLKNPNDSVMNQRVIKLAWPIFLQLLLGISLGYVDTIMLSNYNETAVGAIGNANQVLGFLTLAFNIISSATGIIVQPVPWGRQKRKDEYDLHGCVVIQPCAEYCNQLCCIHIQQKSA